MIFPLPFHWDVVIQMSAALLIAGILSWMGYMFLSKILKGQPGEKESDPFPEFLGSEILYDPESK